MPFDELHGGQRDSAVQQHESFYDGLHAELDQTSGLSPAITAPEKTLACLPCLEIGGAPAVADNTTDQAVQPVLSNGELITRLGSADFRTRDRAHAELAARGLCALPDLIAAQNTSDLETRRRSGQLIDILGTSALPFVLSAAGGAESELRGLARDVLARYSNEDLLSHLYDRPADGAIVMATRPGSRDAMQQMLDNLSEQGTVPATAQGFRAAIAAAELTGRHVQGFHLATAYGTSLLRAGDSNAGLTAVDRALDILTRGGDDFTVLHAIDVQQQLTDILSSTQEQTLPAAVQDQIRQRVSRAEQLRQRAQDQ